MRKLWAVLAGGSAILMAAETASALPAFARRYEVECHFCHDGYPKLNSNGQRFKERGFRMAQEDAFDLDAWARTVPLTLRVEGNHRFPEEGDGTSFVFFKGISAGNLGSRVSYWIDDGVIWDDVSDDFNHTRIDNGWARFELVKNGKLYLKGGRFELDLPFTQTRTPNLSSYEIYTANVGFETDGISFFQDGLELGGALPGDAHWSAAVVKGHNRDADADLNSDVGKFDANVFLRASKRIQRHRIGAFAYIGRSTLLLQPISTYKDDLLRVGADADLRLAKLNLYGVVMYGRNSNPVASPSEPSGTHDPLDYTGGFVQGDYSVRDDVQVTLRFNAVNLPTGLSSSSSETFTSIFPGIRVFVRERLKLSFEYGFHNQDQPNVGIVQAELAF
jgi:hypothetical protein